MEEKSLSIQEVATYFEVTRQTVYNWIGNGWLRTVRVGKAKKRLHVPMDSIKEFAAERDIDISDLDRDNEWVSPCAAAA